MDAATQQLLTAIRADLGAVAARLDAALGGAAPAALTTEQKVGLWATAYGEAGNYDRHYSATRSGLTILLVTVGLGAAWQAADRLKAIGTACQLAWWSVAGQAAMALGITLLLFLLAVVINLHFQKYTVACEIIQQEIDRRLAAETNMAGVAARTDRRTQGIGGFAFRSDLKLVLGKLRPFYFDAMASILLIAIFAFFGLVVASLLKDCLTWILGLCWIGIPILAAVILGWIGRMIARAL